MTTRPPFLLDLRPFDRLTLDSAAILCSSIGRDITTRGYTLSICRYFVAVAAACASAAQGVRPVDTAFPADLHDATDDEIVDVMLLLDGAGDIVEECATDAGHDLLHLIGTPLDLELVRRTEARVMQ